MFMSVLSGLIVSVDAFFIGISLGLQSKCKFIYLAAINAILFGLCILGYLAAGHIYEFIGIDTDIIVGLLFIALGGWYILQYFAQAKLHKGIEYEASRKTIVLSGAVMSVEAMLITMGITFIFLPYSTFAIPITVALAHFGYSSLSFFLVRTKHMKRVPTALSHVISGSALIIYGLMAIFIEFGI